MLMAKDLMNSGLLRDRYVADLFQRLQVGLHLTACARNPTRCYPPRRHTCLLERRLTSAGTVDSALNTGLQKACVNGGQR